MAINANFPTIETIVKEKVKFCCEQRLEKNFPISVKLLEDITEDLVIRLETYIYQNTEGRYVPNYRIEKYKNRYPSNWFEACKQKFYSGFKISDPIDFRILSFLVKRFPIKWKYLTTEKVVFEDRPKIKEFKMKTNDNNLFQSDLFYPNESKEII